MKPMMAQALDIEKLDKYRHYYVEPKYDGMRLLIQLDKGKVVKALTRSGRDVLPQVPVEWLRQASPWFQEFYARYEFEWLDCEFGYPSDHLDIDFNRTMRVMGSGPAEAQRKASELDKLFVAHVFDIPNMPTPFNARRALLDEWNDYIYEASDLDYTHGELLQRAPVSVVPWRPAYNDAFYHYVVKHAGMEGIMLKNPDSLYEPGKRRANTWYKLKAFDTLDMFVVGFDEGQGKYEGLIGAIVCQTTDGLELRCSGMTDEERLSITARQSRIIREKWVLEVKHFGLTAGTPRHPQFLRWRTDKSWEECSWTSQMPNPKPS